MYLDVDMKMTDNDIQSDSERNIDESEGSAEQMSEKNIDQKVCEIRIDSNPDESLKKGISFLGFELKQIKWINLIFLIWLHLFALYGYVHGLFSPVRIFTVIWVSLLSIFSGLGMSVGKSDLRLKFQTST